MKPKILHIDDSPTILEVVGVHLRKAGYEVESCPDSTQAMDFVSRENFRIVILDIEMPGINGVNLLEQIKAYDGGIQVIMLTGLVNISSVLSTQRRGASACLFKPLKDYDELTKAVDAAVQRIQYWHNCVTQLQQLKTAAV